MLSGGGSVADDDDDSSYELGEDNHDDEGDAPWEGSTRSRIRAILETAEYDVDDGTIKVWDEDWDPRGKSRGSRTFSDLEDLRQVLVEIGDGEMSANVPWENGPVFSTDSDGIVDEVLGETGVESFFTSL